MTAHTTTIPRSQALHAPPAAPATDCLVGLVLEEVHPTLQSRVQVQWVGESGGEHRAWLPTLHGMAVRRADRVLIQHARNWPEPIVTGVIDGFAARPSWPRRPAAALTLKPDEALRIDASSGTPLVEIVPGEAGPVVRLLDADVELELEGRLRVAARSIELAARQGAVDISATDDVNVKGEMIKLN